MEKLRDPWVCGVGLTLFVLVILATATRVSPPTPLTSERPTADSEPREAAYTASASNYVWLTRRQAAQYFPLVERIAAPEGFTRAKLASDGFANWLRHLPVAAADVPVTSGRRKVLLKADDSSLAAVIQLQPSNDRLLAGANMLVRLRAEYAWTTKNLDNLGFHFTSGHLATWESWSRGERPKVKGREVQFEKSFDPDSGRESFCSYLETIFQYGSVYSVLADTHPVKDGSLAPGDVFLRAARKGAYSLIVVDACTSPEGELRILLGNAGTPAQTFHILRSSDGSPWFTVRQNHDIALPDGRGIRLSDLRRWN